MLTTSVVFANPFTAEAARVTFDPSKYGNYQGESLIGKCYRMASAGSMSIGLEIQANLKDIVLPAFVPRYRDGETTCPDFKTNDNNYTFDSNKLVPEFYSFYDYRDGVVNLSPGFQSNEITKSGHVVNERIVTGAQNINYSVVPAKGNYIKRYVSAAADYNGYTYGNLATGYLPNAIEADVRIYYFGVDTTELYNLYKDLYIGYYGGFYTVTPVDTFSKAMHAADMVLQGKLDEEIVLPVDKGGYGYICICQELIDAIVADLKSVNVEVTFSKTIITSSNPADAATFNTIKTPSNYKDGLDVTVNVNTAKYNVNNPKLIVKDQYGVLGEYSLKQSSGSAYTCNVPITGDISEIVATGFAAKEYTVSIPASSAYTRSAESIKVVHGNTGKFSITLKDAYNRATPVARIDGKELARSDKGNGVFEYTTAAITGNKTVIFDTIPVNNYPVSYTLGTGVLKGAETATTIQYGSNATVKIDVDPAYSQVETLPISVTNGTLSTGTRNGNTFTYTLSGVTADTTVTVPALTKNQYTVTVPTAIGLDITNTGSHTKTYGDSFIFTVTKQTGYTQATPVVKVNDVEIAGVPSDNTYTYTITNITENKNVTIDNMPLNTYQYTLPTGTGFKVTNAAGMDCNSITHGNDYSFVVSVNKAYTQTKPTVTLASGKTLELVSTAPGADGSIDYTYKAANVTAHDTVQVAAMDKNTYTAVLPTGKGYTAKTDDNLNKIVYGTSISFGVELEKQYDRSNVVVKYNGSVLEPTAGVYKIDNITSNITAGMITVDGVELNHYYITLPLETETGFTIAVGEGQNAKSVLSGSDFDFKFFLDPAYSNSNPVIKYSADGGDNYKVLTEKDGKYTIEKVLSDCIVVVEGVKKNTYTVNFTQEDGKTIIKQYKDVEYGAEIVFDGTEPEKASEKLDEYTDKDGNKVVVTKEYKFAGWSADTTKVVSNMTVTPIFEVSEVTKTYPKEGGGDPIIVVTPKTANILFISGGVIVHKATVTKGESFDGWNGVPVKTSSNPYETYTFTGWDTDRDGVVDFDAGESNAIADVQNDVTFTAVFESNLPSRTVSYYNFDGSELLYSASIKCGEKAEYGLSGSPERRDNANLYDFAGWAFETDADESKVVDSFIVGESEINLYAAYKKTPIVYSYKYVDYDYDKVTGEPEPFQEGTFYFTDDDKPSYKYLGVTPTREPDVDKVYAFDGWNVKQSGYTTVYTATYKDSVREYTSNLPTPDSTYTITENKTVKYGDTFSFTVTLSEGYEETAPAVTSNGNPIEPTDVTGNSYTYEIKLDGATAEEVYGDLTVTVGTTINNYDVAIGGDAGCEVDPLAFNSAHGGSGSFIVTLKEGYTQTAPTITSDGKVTVKLESSEGNKYVYSVTGIMSDAAIKVTTKINEYKVVMVNYDGEKVFEGVLEHGQTPSYTNPGKPTDKFGGYTFAGWDTDGDGVKDVDAIANVTCDITATAVYTCSHVHADDPTADGTAWVLDSTEKADCEHDGTRHYKCSYPGCTQTMDWTIEKRGHNMGEYTVTLAPTCTKDGSKVRYCVNAETEDYAKCNHSETAVVPKLGHAYGEWKTIVAPTCTEKGKAERVCANDPSHKEYKDVDATGHHDYDGDYICDDCGADLGHCSKCICHKNNILSKVLRYTCTLLTKIFHKPIKCCKDMDWYNGNISSIS